MSDIDDQLLVIFREATDIRGQLRQLADWIGEVPPGRTKDCITGLKEFLLVADEEFGNACSAAATRLKAAQQTRPAVATSAVPVTATSTAQLTVPVNGAPVAPPLPAPNVAGNPLQHPGLSAALNGLLDDTGSGAPFAAAGGSAACNLHDAANWLLFGQSTGPQPVSVTTVPGPGRRPTRRRSGQHPFDAENIMDNKTEICAECRRSFTPLHQRQVVCSDECDLRRKRRQKSESAQRTPAEKKAAILARANARRLSITKTCPKCGNEFHPRKSDQQLCGRACVDDSKRKGTAKRERVVSPEEMEQWQVAVVEERESDRQWLTRYAAQRGWRHRRSVHSALLERHGLPADIRVTSKILGIGERSLRTRILRDPNNFLYPLRRRKWRRPIMLPLNIEAARAAAQSEDPIRHFVSSEFQKHPIQIDQPA